MASHTAVINGEELSLNGIVFIGPVVTQPISLLRDDYPSTSTA